MFPYVSKQRPDGPGPPYLVALQDYVDALRNNSTGSAFQMDTCTPYENDKTVASRKGQEFVGWWSCNGKQHALDREQVKNEAYLEHRA
jgi:hypothetical protein